MAINLKQSPTKDLLQRSSIRTMKKDLAMLRETDLLQEKQKISKIKITKEEPLKEEEPLETELKIEEKLSQPSPPLQSAPGPADFPLPKKEEPSVVAPEKLNIQPPVNLPTETEDDSFGEDDMQAKVKNYASETEKQQIFLLKAKKTHLENQMREGSAKSGSSEKSKLLSEKKNWQEKLNTIVKEEEKNEQEQKMIQKKEEESDVPTEQQKFKEERMAKEEQGENIEKKKWSIESELAKLENKIKSLDEGQKQLEVLRNNIEKELTDIDDSLKVIYGNILKREEAKKGQQGPARKEMEAQGASENKIAPAAGKDILKEPEYLRGISPAAKEKLARSAEIEQKQRLKFMEDVERWVAFIKARERENN